MRSSPGGGRGNPLQYSCLENPMDRGAWQATVHGVAKSQAWLKQLSSRSIAKRRQEKVLLLMLTSPLRQGDRVYQKESRRSFLSGQWCPVPCISGLVSLPGQQRIASWDVKTAEALVVESLSCVRLFSTPWTAARQASLSFTISWSLLKPMSIESVMPSNHLILCRRLLLLPSIFPSIRVFSNELALCIKWPKYWSFSISPSNEYSGLTVFRIDWFDLLAVQGTLKNHLQHHILKASILKLWWRLNPGRRAFSGYHFMQYHLWPKWMTQITSDDPSNLTCAELEPWVTGKASIVQDHMLEIGPAGKGLLAARSLRGNDGSTQKGTIGTLQPHSLPTVVHMSPGWIPTHSRNWHIQPGTHE